MECEGAPRSPPMGWGKELSISAAFGCCAKMGKQHIGRGCARKMLLRAGGAAEPRLGATAPNGEFAAVLRAAASAASLQPCPGSAPSQLLPSPFLPALLPGASPSIRPRSPPLPPLRNVAQDPVGSRCVVPAPWPLAGGLAGSSMVPFLHSSLPKVSSSSSKLLLRTHADHWG